jgi:hypothetical protein
MVPTEEKNRFLYFCLESETDNNIYSTASSIIICRDETRKKKHAKSLKNMFEKDQTKKKVVFFAFDASKRDFYFFGKIRIVPLIYMRCLHTCLYQRFENYSSLLFLLR